MDNYFTEENLKNQLTEAIQIYFDRNKVNEKANVTMEVIGAGRLYIKVQTVALLGYERMEFINKLAWMLMPPGIMHELVNVVDGNKGEVNYEEYKALPGVDKQLPDSESGLPIAMPANKKGKRKRANDTGEDIYYEGI